MSTVAKRSPSAHQSSPDGGLQLSPSQQLAYEQLLEAVAASPIVTLEGDAGAGKSLLVDRVIAARGGIRIGARDTVLAASGGAHAGIEDNLHRLLDESLRKYDVVVFEDVDLYGAMSYSPGYLRASYLDVMLQSLFETARSLGKRLILTGSNFWAWPEQHTLPRVPKRSCKVNVPPFTADDYAFFLNVWLDETTANAVGAARMFEYAPGLTTYKLRQFCALFERAAVKDQAAVREILDERILTTNANLGEIADVKFSDLKGFEKIVDELNTYVLNPLRFDERFDGMGFLPKRGVLLYGPPGTGKTSIGRALAHQMKGKFFIIDGTFTTEPAATFYGRVKQVFEAAKLATPSVIFIDDADVLFESDRTTGLFRFLLTMLDGLESATAGKVAVIMTAMNPNRLPPALLRSGRVELWIETRPPEEKARAEIVAAHLATLPEAFRSYDLLRSPEQTAGFNAADMKRLVADVKALYAKDVIAGRPPRAAVAYFDEASQNVRRNKERLQQAEAGTLQFGTDAGCQPSEAELKRRRARGEQEECGG